MLDKRWNGIGRCIVANLRVADFGLPMMLRKSAGHERRFIDVV